MYLGGKFSFHPTRVDNLFCIVTIIVKLKMLIGSTFIGTYLKLQNKESVIRLTFDFIITKEFLFLGKKIPINSKTVCKHDYNALFPNICHIITSGIGKSIGGISWSATTTKEK